MSVSIIDVRKGNSPSKVCRGLLRSSQTKVCDTYPLSIPRTEDVLRFEISVEDTHRVAILDRVDDLEEDRFDQHVVADIPLLLGDHPKQVALVTKVHNDKDVVALLDDLVQGHNVGVPRRELVKRDLSPLEVPLSRVETGPEKAFDGEVYRSRSMKVDGEVDHSIGSKTENRKELETTVVEGVTDERWTRVGESVGRHYSTK